MFFNNGIKLILAILVFTPLIGGCKKLVDIKAPVTSLNEANVYVSDATAISVLTGIYTDMSQDPNFTGYASIALFSSLSSDELTLYSGVGSASHIAYYKNSLLSNSSQTYGAETWSPLYHYIFRCNAAIEGLNGTNSLTPMIKKQLLGEAKFLRAFFYFYLVNLYGDVPLITSTDPEVNSLLSRTAITQIYGQIIADLKDAQASLSDKYLNAQLNSYTNSSERVRPTVYAATALLARVYLYTGDWVHSEEQSTMLINNASLFSLTELNNSFLANSSEAIWQLQPVINGHNTEDARIFIIPSTGPSDVSASGGNPVYVSNELLNSFEPGDQRKIKWINNIIVGNDTFYFPYKYKINDLNLPVTEYLMVFRLAEQYLIRAEARARQGKVSAVDDLNMIRSRAGLASYSGPTDMASLIQSILHERRVELFTEWANRWLDLKRTGNINNVMNLVCPQKGGSWNSNKQLFPIPFDDISKDPNLKQNTGY